MVTWICGWSSLLRVCDGFGELAMRLCLIILKYLFPISFLVVGFDGNMSERTCVTVMLYCDGDFILRNIDLNLIFAGCRFSEKGRRVVASRSW